MFIANNFGITLGRTVTGSTHWPIDYTQAGTWRFFGPPITSQIDPVFNLPITGLRGDIAEFWFAPGIFMDVGDPGIRGLFCSPDLGGGVVKPAELGANGELPNGIVPAFYFSADPDASAFATNRGYAGACTVSGSITDATGP
jgi:hypothetical protein